MTSSARPTIYFAGPITAGRDDAVGLAVLITALTEVGDVVTEHVGSSSLSAEGEKEMVDRDIHDRDLQWLLCSDLVVAEVSTPSFGVGYEIGRAVERRIPVIALRRKSRRRLSAMISGCPDVEVIEYSTTQDAVEKLRAHVLVRDVDRITASSDA